MRKPRIMQTKLNNNGGLGVFFSHLNPYFHYKCDKKKALLIKWASK